MSTALLKEKDVGLRSAVMRQLEWDPEVDASAVGVAAKDGVVTLTGFIDSYHGKLAAERAVKRVKGVRAVANDLSVHLRLERTDPDIAADAARALELRSSVPETVKATVHSGHVTLTGTVSWLFQRSDAEKAVRHIRGVRAVVNRIEVTPIPAAQNVKRLIANALHRAADIDARRISVIVRDKRVILHGRVSSWAEREAADRAARQAPGITAVENELEIVPPLVEYDANGDEIC